MFNKNLTKFYFVLAVTSLLTFNLVGCDGNSSDTPGGNSNSKIELENPGGGDSLKGLVDITGITSSIEEENILDEELSLTVDQPEYGDTVTGIMDVSGTTTGPVDRVIIKVYINGEYAIIEATGTEEWSCSIDTTLMEDGSNNLYIYALDALDNYKFKLINIIVNNSSTTVPGIAITSPANNTSVNGSTVISGTYTNVDSVKIEISQNSSLIASGYAVITGSTWSYTLDISGLSVGSYTVKAIGGDNLAEDSITLNVISNDLGDDVIKILSPETKSIKKGMMTVSGLASSSVASIKIYIPQDNYGVEYSHSGSSWSYQVNTTALSDGSKMLYIYAYNSSGTQLDKQYISIYIYNHPMSLSLGSPISGSSGGQTVTISGTVSNEDNLIVKVMNSSGECVFRSLPKVYDGEWSIVWKSPGNSNGTYTISTTAEDDDFTSWDPCPDSITKSVSYTIISSPQNTPARYMELGIAVGPELYSQSSGLQDVRDKVRQVVAEMNSFYWLSNFDPPIQFKLTQLVFFSNGYPYNVSQDITAYEFRDLFIDWAKVNFTNNDGGILLVSKKPNGANGVANASSMCMGDAYAWAWVVKGFGSNFDVEVGSSVAIHEVAHLFGLTHDTSSAITSCGINACNEEYLKYYDCTSCYSYKSILSPGGDFSDYSFNDCSRYQMNVSMILGIPGIYSGNNEPFSACVTENYRTFVELAPPTGISSL